MNVHEKRQPVGRPKLAMGKIMRLIKHLCKSENVKVNTVKYYYAKKQQQKTKNIHNEHSIFNNAYK